MAEFVSSDGTFLHDGKSRLTLRRLGYDAVDQGYLQWINDIDTNKYLESRFKVWSREDLISYIDKMNQSQSEWLFGMYDEHGTYIGNIKLGPVDPHHHRASVGLMIGRAEARGKGYGREALKQIKKLAFGYLDLKKITAGCYAPNKESETLFLKSGFVIEGTLRDHAECGGERCDVLLFGCLPGGDA